MKVLIVLFGLLVHAETFAAAFRLPDAICVEPTPQSVCRLLNNKTGTVSISELVPGVALPDVICEKDQPNKDGKTSLCQTTQCGDGICSFPEKKTCAADCSLPFTFDICQCRTGRCRDLQITCDTEGCDRQHVAERNRDQCSCPNTPKVLPCTTGDAYCVVLNVLDQKVPCEQYRIDRGKGATIRHEHCADGVCESQDIATGADKATDEGEWFRDGGKK